MNKIKFKILIAALLPFSLYGEDPFTDDTGSRFPVERPFNAFGEDLTRYPLLSWSHIDQLKHGEIKQGVIDGFIKVYKINDNEGKVSYSVYIYRTTEDMKFKRLGSCVYVSDVNYKDVRSDDSLDSIDALDGCYCVISCLFKRNVNQASSLGYCMDTYSLYVKSSPPKKKHPKNK